MSRPKKWVNPVECRIKNGTKKKSAPTKEALDGFPFPVERDDLVDGRDLMKQLGEVAAAADNLTDGYDFSLTDNPMKSLDAEQVPVEETTELKTENSMSSEPTKTAELSQVETEVQPGTEQGVVVAQAPTPQGENEKISRDTNGDTPGSVSWTAFYQPKGPAGEYAAQGYGLNLFKGCRGGCIYCYREHGIISKSIGGDTPVLLKKYKDEAGALTRIAHDLDNHKNELVAADGVFATFTSDPGQEATFPLFKQAFDLIIEAGVPVKMLTKFTSWVNTPEGQELLAKGASTGLLAVGFTLTGHDELETGASPNADRVAAMKSIHSMGIKTFASIEPVIDQQTSLDMVKAVAGYCDMFLVGLESGPNRHVLTDDEVSNMSHQMIDVVRSCGVGSIYFKSSILKVAKAASVIASEGSGIVVSKSIMF